MEQLIAMMRDMAEEFDWVVAMVFNEYGDEAGLVIGPQEWVLEEFGTDADIYTIPESTLEH